MEQLTKEQIRCKITKHLSDTYLQTLLMRYSILRRPLNRPQFDIDEITQEKNDIHCVLFFENHPASCLVLTPLYNKRIKMRQVCTYENFRRKGYAKKLAIFAEEVSKERGFEVIECNARKYAVSFYKELGYSITSEEFLEVGIPHFKMEKNLIKIPQKPSAQ